MENSKDVSLVISKEIVTPIVNAKIQEALVGALGGGDVIIQGVVNQILHQKVNAEGKVSNYSSDNKHNWIDIVVTKTIEDAVKDQMKIFLVEAADKIKKEIVKQLSTKKGIEQFAASLLDQTTKISERYYSNIKIEFTNK